MAYQRWRSPPYKPGQAAPYKISRSKIDLFVQCPRCFWLDARLKIARPSSPPFTLNSAVDNLLKNEFDQHRIEGTQHPLQEAYGIACKPVEHDKLNIWRENFKGVQHLHEPTNLLITGAIDDLWQDGDAKYVVVDYKSTSKIGKIESIGESPWHAGYQRQLEVYQWLLRQNGLDVSNTGYWVYCNADKDKKAFDGKLEFEITLIAYEGKDNWIESILSDIKACLESDEIPKIGKAVMDPTKDCEHCTYGLSRTIVTLEEMDKKHIKVKDALKKLKR